MGKKGWGIAGAFIGISLLLLFLPGLIKHPNFSPPEYYDVLANILGGAVGALATIWVLKREFVKHDEDRMARCVLDVHYKCEAKDIPKAILPARWRKIDWPAEGLSCLIVSSAVDEIISCKATISIDDSEVIHENPGLMITGYVCAIPLCQLDSRGTISELRTNKPFTIKVEYTIQQDAEIRKTVRNTFSYFESLGEDELGYRIETEDMIENCHILNKRGELDKVLIDKHEGPLYEWIPER